VARLGVNPADFTTSPLRETRSPLEIICVARLAPVKAHPVLLDAFARLVREGRDVRLHLVGDGPDRAELEARCARAQLNQRVVFHGWRNYDDVAALYRQADIAVLASFDEGIPVALMEAMAMQIPCVATNVGGLPELIQDGVNGLLVPASDAEGLAQALARLFGDTSLRCRLGQAARDRILRDFDLLKNVDRLAEIFTRRLA
jgi:glycosyltransferase involved in cell wall biosynthesis